MIHIKAFKKILSVALAFILLVNANISVFAQNVPQITRTETEQLRAEIRERLNIITESDIKRLYRREYNFKSLFNHINRQGFENNYGDVCDGEICAPYHTFMRGLIGALLEFVEGDSEILLNYIYQIRNAIFLGALASEDIKPLKELLKDGIKHNVTYCDSPSIFRELWDTAKENLYIQDRDFGKKQKAQDNCETAMAAITILSVITENAQDAQDTADYIYNILDKYQTSTLSSLVLMDTIAALSFIDTDYSYSLIEKFLTDDTTPSIRGNRTREALNMFIPSGIFEGVNRQVQEEFNNSTAYLNRYNTKWQYLNTEATAKQGIDIFWLTNIAYSLDSFTATKHDKQIAYRIVYNNILTDVGEFLSSQDGRGKELAQKIVAKYANASKEEHQTMHLPLILGLIQNLDTPESLAAARILNTNFYYDINGGTGKLVAQRSALENSGLNPNRANTISEDSFCALKNIRHLSFVADIVTIVFSLASLAKSLPSIISNLKNLRNLFAVRNTKAVATTYNAARTSTQLASTNRTTALVVNTMPALSQVPALTRTVPVLLKTAPKAITLSQSANAFNKFRKGLKVKNTTANVQFALTAAPKTEAAVTAANNAAEVAASTEAAASTEEALNTAIASEIVDGLSNSVAADKSLKEFIIVHNLNWLDDLINLRPLKGAFTANFFKLLPPQQPTIRFTPAKPSLQMTSGAGKKPFFRKTSMPIRLTANDENVLSGKGQVPGPNSNKLNAPNDLDRFGLPMEKKPVDIHFRFFPFPTVSFKIDVPRKVIFPQNPVKVDQITNSVAGKNPFNFKFTFMPFGSATDAVEEIPQDIINALMIDGSSIPFNKITAIEPVKRGFWEMGAAVVKLKDAEGNIVAVEKYGTVEEINETSIFHITFVQNKLGQKYPLVEVEYPQILTLDETVLPENIRREVQRHMANVKRKLWGVNRGQKPFIMTNINTSGFTYYDIKPKNKKMIMEKLGNQPITYGEWKQFEEIIAVLNAKGVVHPDLLRNIFFRRDNGKLVIGLLDFEPVNAHPLNNRADLDAIGSALDRVGARDMKAHSPVEMPKPMPNIAVNAAKVKPNFTLEEPSVNFGNAAQSEFTTVLNETESDLANSVLKLKNIDGSFSGFLTEVPIQGVNRQVIVSVGHAVGEAPGSAVSIYSRSGDMLGKASTLFFNFRKPNTKDVIDYALLLPHEQLPLKPLNFITNKNPYNFAETLQMGYPNGNFGARRIVLDRDLSDSYNPNISFLRGTTPIGTSGSPMFVETAPNDFRVLGNMSGCSEENGCSIMHNLNWLDDFINGRPIKAFFPTNLTDFTRPARFKFMESPFSSKNANGFKLEKPSLDNTLPLSNPANVLTNTMTFKFTSAPADRPYLPIEHFNNYESAMLSPIGNIGKRTNPMWGVYDVMGNINKFLMYGTESDIRSMRSFEKMLEENDLKNKYRLIIVEYPQFISVIDEGVPSNVWDDIAEIKGNVQYPSAVLPYTTTPIRTSGAIWAEEDPGVNERFLENSDFADNPITEDEWDEVLALVQDINNNDFIFDDFEKSVILRRNSSGQLVLGFTKYKYTPLATDNYTDAIEMGRKFERIGLKTDKHGIVKKPSKTTKQDVAKILNGVTRAEIVVTEYDPGKLVVHAVWRLYNQDNIVGYLKFGTEDEIINTRKIEKVFTENDLLGRFNNHIEVQFPRILADNVDDLPPEILREVYDKFELNKHLIRNAKDRAKKMFILSPVDDDVFCWGNLGKDLQSIYTALARLGGGPIKAEAWEEFYNLMFTLQKLGVPYDDVYNNIAFKSKTGDKLKVVFSDFENEGTSNMLIEVRDLGRSLTKYGLKEPHYYIDNLEFETDLPF